MCLRAKDSNDAVEGVVWARVVALANVFAASGGVAAILLISGVRELPAFAEGVKGAIECLSPKVGRDGDIECISKALGVKELINEVLCVPTVAGEFEREFADGFENGGAGVRVRIRRSVFEEGNKECRCLWVEAEDSFEGVHCVGWANRSHKRGHGGEIVWDAKFFGNEGDGLSVKGECVVHLINEEIWYPIECRAGAIVQSDERCEGAKLGRAILSVVQTEGFVPPPGAGGGGGRRAVVLRGRWCRWWWWCAIVARVRRYEAGEGDVSEAGPCH